MALFDVLKSCDIRNLKGTELFQNLENKLKEDKWYKPLLDYSEQSSNVNRVYIVAGCGSVLLSALLYHFGIQLICGAVGFLYPGYETIQCLENFDVQAGKRWLTYWLIFSTFNFIEIFLFFLHWFPGYSILKCAFFIWCYVPFSPNGSDVIYNFLIRPFIQKNQEVIDNAISHFRDTAQSIYTNAEVR